MDCLFGDRPLKQKNATVNMVIGVLLGWPIYVWVQLVAKGAWLMALILLVFGGVLYALIILDGKLWGWFDRLFSIGRIRPAKNPQPELLKPLLRVLSLPLGLLVGVVLATSSPTGSTC